MNYTEKMEDALFELRGYGDDDEYTIDKIIEFINEEKSFRSFGEALTDLINHKFKDDNNCSAEDVLRRCAREKGISINRNTITNWFAGNRPKKGEQSREHMFLIAFALELTYQETCELFKKVYYDRPFNLRNPSEYIYLYCILAGETYQTAEHMIEQVNLCKYDAEDNTIYTKLLSEEVDKLSTEGEVISFINSHPHNFMIDSKSAKELVAQLIYQIKGREDEKVLLGEGKIDINSSYIARECDKIDGLLEEGKSLTSISTMVDIILGINMTNLRKEEQKSWFKNANLPHEIISRFPTKHTFSKENPSAEELRKIIILLFSYKFWFDKQYEEYELDIDDYIGQIDELLDSVGLQTMYYGNPFDWMFMYCSLDDYPLDMFRNIMAEVTAWD